MSNLWGAPASPRPTLGGQPSTRRALGAGERSRWSSLVRQEDIDTVVAALQGGQLHGTVIMGPRGVGKSTLARNVAKRLGPDVHVVRLFGSGVETEVPYSLFSVHLARLTARQTETPPAVHGALVEMIAQDAMGRPVVIVVDELPGIDNLSMGVLMHLVLGGKAKLLVAARSAADFPEDLVWMIKDGLLAQRRLVPFSRAEVRTLMVRALGGPVAESVIASLYSTSAGNPLVLAAMVHEYLESGTLAARDGVWVSYGRLESYSEDILLELVESRMGREPVEMRRSIEKFSLFRKLPLAMAMAVLGAEHMARMEERGYLSIGTDPRRTVSFAEPYFGEMVRNGLPTEQKAAYFEELASGLDLTSSELSMQELLTFAAWINDAGLVLQPDVALAAAQAALHFYNPQLALSCCSHVPAGHKLALLAQQQRSRAHYLMANYAHAAELLEESDAAALRGLDAAGYASWALDLTVALLWTPDPDRRIADVLAAAAQRIQDAPPGEREAAERHYNLARFEVHIHRGEFAEIAHDLEIGSKCPDDREYRLNCACLLTIVYATTGREKDAVELSADIDAESLAHNVVLRMNDWQLYGRIMAMTWSGQWRNCEAALQQAIEYSNDALHYRGGAIELALGVVYALVGKHMQAAEVLLAAAAQLEVRDSYRSLEAAYSALSYVHAKLDERGQSEKFLAMARASAKQTVWLNRSIADYFQALAGHHLGEGTAVERLVAGARQDLAQGRFTPSSTGFLAAVMLGDLGSGELLEQSSASCQGPLAEITVLLGAARRDRTAQPALDAAARAHELELPQLESHGLHLALELATEQGDARLQREARRGLNSAVPDQAETAGSTLVPLTSREQQVARLANRGMSNKDIAAKIGVSVRTVEGHLYQVFMKMGITSRTELEMWVGL